MEAIAGCDGAWVMGAGYIVGAAGAGCWTITGGV